MPSELEYTMLLSNRSLDRTAKPDLRYTVEPVECDAKTNEVTSSTEYLL